MPDESTSPSRESAIVDAFVYLADTLVDDFDVIEFLHYLTERCVEFGTVDEAAVMLAAPNGHLQAVAASTERSRLLELFELQNVEGPCLDAFRTGTVVAVDDLSVEAERWPTFAPHAVDVGYRAVHSIPLKLRERIIGALNLLRAEPGAVSTADAKLLRALTDIATIGVLQERTIAGLGTHASGLQLALTSRIRIEQAKGILAERHRLTVDDAFALLRTYTRRRGLRLTDVAIGVVERSISIPSPSTGHWPDGRLGRPGS
jgi:GAF domain-containing protein